MYILVFHDLWTFLTSRPHVPDSWMSGRSSVTRPAGWSTPPDALRNAVHKMFVKATFDRPTYIAQIKFRDMPV